jgi:hypothetical protein
VTAPLFPLIAPRPRDPHTHTTTEHYEGYAFSPHFVPSPRCENCLEIAREVFGITIPAGATE